jgi:hypothetical protein
MKNIERMKQFTVLRDEYGEPRMHIGGMYRLFDGRLVICVDHMTQQALDRAQKGRSLQDAIQVLAGAVEPETKKDQTKEVYGLLPMEEGEFEKNHNGILVNSEGVCEGNLEHCVMFEYKYELKQCTFRSYRKEGYDE